MAKKYSTEGRTLYNYRGRTGRLTLVPTAKSAKGWAVCDTFGTASRVLEAVFNADVESIGTEPKVILPTAPSGQVHLDIREQRREGFSHFVEVKAEIFAAQPHVVSRLLEVRERVNASGDSFELVLRDEVVKRVQNKGLQFLYRFKSELCQPSAKEQERIRSLCSTGDPQSRTAWLVRFKAEGLHASGFYWALAQGHLVLDGSDALFPDGQVRGSRT